MKGRFTLKTLMCVCMCVCVCMHITAIHFFKKHGLEKRVRRSIWESLEAGKGNEIIML